LLQKCVLTNTGVAREEVIVPAAFGEDSSVVDLKGDLCVLSTDPITGSGSEAGWLAVHVSCNDVASNGAEPLGVMLTLLVPEGWDTAEIEKLMEQADRAAHEVGVQIIGGHTEITPNIPQAILSTTVVGRTTRERLVTSAGLQEGSSIIVTKGVGLEGTAIFALDFEEQLRAAGVSGEVIDRAGQFATELSVVPEARTATDRGATAMHDVTEGGIMGALYELASASEVGLEVDKTAMPIRPETVAVCEALEVNPLRLIGSGALLIGAPDQETAQDIIGALTAQGITAAVVARALSPDAGLWVKTAEARHELEPPESDELWRVLDRLG
jgi:hydrogenase maturation factor